MTDTMTITSIMTAIGMPVPKFKVRAIRRNGAVASYVGSFNLDNETFFCSEDIEERLMPAIVRGNKNEMSPWHVVRLEAYYEKPVANLDLQVTDTEITTTFGDWEQA